VIIENDCQLRWDAPDSAQEVHVNTMTIEKIEAAKPTEATQEIIQRLYELGLRPGVEIKIIRRISFGTVTVIEYGHTRLALNEQEMSCLHGH
jgi:Fe2+ transport system protein FeoA